MVRTRLIFERQTPAVQASILAAVIAEARAFATPAGIEIPNAAHLATAVKARRGARFSNRSPPV
jgi:hypothetical protein